MRSSKLPVAVKKTYAGALIKKKSPLDQIRDNFEKKRADEKLKIRAIALYQQEHGRQKLLSNGDGIGIHNTVLDNQIDQHHHAYSNGLNHVQKRVVVVDTPAALRRPEKRSAGRDRSHPLEPLVDVRVRRSISEGNFLTGDKKADNTLPQTLLNNTYTVVKPPLVQLVREQRNYEQRIPKGLPLVERPSIPTDNNLQLERINFDRSCTPGEVLKPSYENEIAFRERENINMQHTNQVSHGNSELSTEKPHRPTNGRIPYTPLPHSNMDSENNLLSTVHLYDVPFSPTATDESPGNYLRELRAMRKNKLKQQHKMNGPVADQDDKCSSVQDHISGRETRKNVQEEHIQRQYSDLQYLRKQKLQQLQVYVGH